MKIKIPLSVAKKNQKEYIKNFKQATLNTGNLFIFAGDQKVEHLNDDFVGEGVSNESANPEHLFKIASQLNLGLFATQLGLIDRYGMDYNSINYLVKLNSKTNLVPTDMQDPLSTAWYSVKDVINFKKETKLKISAVGYTIYLGSMFEAKMLNEAAQIIYEAHREGLLAVIWMYPRGKAVKNEKDVHLIAGGAGVAVALGADFVKVNFPYESKVEAKKFTEVVEASGRTGVLCVGGGKKRPKEFLENIHNQINSLGTRGVAVGRNIHQRDLKEALAMAKAIASIVYYKQSAQKALNFYKSNS